MIKGDPETIRDIILSTFKSFVDSRTKLDDIYSSNEKFGDIEENELLDFLLSHFNKLQKKYNNLFTFEFPAIRGYDSTNKVQRIVFLANKYDMERVINNIVENAITHGEFDANKGKNKFFIDLNIWMTFLFRHIWFLKKNYKMVGFQKVLHSVHLAKAKANLDGFWWIKSLN